MGKEERVKPGKAKSKETKVKEVGDQDVSAVPYEVRMKSVTPISKPMASEKKTKKFYKLVRRATKDKAARRGVKEVCKGIRQGKRGICVIAGDITPIDVISHLAYHCEEQGVEYIYVPSKVDLGAAAKTKRPTSCVLVTPPPEAKGKWDSKELFDELTTVCKEEMSQVPSV